MALLKNLWKRLAGHQGLIQTLAVVAEPRLVRGHDGDRSSLSPWAGLWWSRMGCSCWGQAGWIPSLQNTLIGKGSLSYSVYGDSNARASQLAGFLWEVIGRQKWRNVLTQMRAELMRPAAWESWCGSVWWVGESPFWTAAAGCCWLVCWLLLSRLLGNHCDQRNCETHSTVDSRLTVRSETSLWK